MVTKDDMKLFFQSVKFAPRSMVAKALFIVLCNPARGELLMDGLRKGKSFRYAVEDSEKSVQ